MTGFMALGLAAEAAGAFAKDNIVEVPASAVMPIKYGRLWIDDSSGDEKASLSFTGPEALKLGREFDPSCPTLNLTSFNGRLGTIHVGRNYFCIGQLTQVGPEQETAEGPFECVFLFNPLVTGDVATLRESSYAGSQCPLAPGERIDDAVELIRSWFEIEQHQSNEVRHVEAKLVFDAGRSHAGTLTFSDPWMVLHKGDEPKSMIAGSMVAASVDRIRTPSPVTENGGAEDRLGAKVGCRYYSGGKSWSCSLLIGNSTTGALSEVPRPDPKRNP